MMKCLLSSLLLVPLAGIAGAQEPIKHDAEYYILESQHADRWAADNAEVDERLAGFRETNRRTRSG